MPIVIKNPSRTYSELESRGKEHRKNMKEQNYDYDYPNDLDLKPGSKTHDDLRDYILMRSFEAREHIQKRFDSWREIDRTLTAYVQPKRKTTNNSKKKDDRTYIIIPMTYAEKETLLTYMVAAFLQDPVFRYSGTGPEDVIPAKLLESIVQKHVVANKVGLSLYSMFNDAISYGLGIVSPYWKVKWGTQRKLQPSMFEGIMTGFRQFMGMEIQPERVVKFEGNALHNIDPYLYLPDPEVSVHDVQDGGSVGWVERTNETELLKRDQDPKDFIINGRYVKHIDGRSVLTTAYEGGSRADAKFGMEKGSGTYSTRPVDLIHRYADIIPKEFDLGDNEYPERWLFTLAGDEVIVAAQPLNMDHGDYPVAVASPNFDGYSAAPMSKLEVVSGMQNTIDWLISSHITNVKKVVNDMFVVDPMLANIYDFTKEGEGKLIRMREEAWGQGLTDKAVTQLKVQDVTQNHITDIGFLVNFMQRVSAAADNVQGIVQNRGPRISAEQARGARVSALSRMEKDARAIHMMAMRDIAYQFASNTQQMMDRNTYVKITGEMEERLAKTYGKRSDQGRFPVSPMDIITEYDIVEHDGSMPGGEPPDLWIQLFQIIGQSEELTQTFDIPRVFRHIARQLGAKNVEDFTRQTNVQTMDNEEVERQRQNGNIIPADQFGGGF